MPVVTYEAGVVREIDHGTKCFISARAGERSLNVLYVEVMFAKDLEIPEPTYQTLSSLPYSRKALSRLRR